MPEPQESVHDPQSDQSDHPSVVVSGVVVGGAVVAGAVVAGAVINSLLASVFESEKKLG